MGTGLQYFIFLDIIKTVKFKLINKLERYRIFEKVLACKLEDQSCFPNNHAKRGVQSHVPLTPELRR